MIGRLLALGLIVTIASSCSIRKKDLSEGILEDIRNPEVAVITRLSLTSKVPEAVASGAVSKDEAAEALKDVVWMRRLPSQLRIAALDELVKEGGLLSATDGENLVMGLLPTETDPIVRHSVCQHIVRRNWIDATPSLVRAFSKVDRTLPDGARPEHMALLELYRDKDIQEIVFDTFIAFAPTGGDDLGTRIRRDAWNLLSRLDASGELRVNLLTQLLDDPPSESDPMLAALRRGLLELRTIPLTGEELEWLARLQETSEGETKEWWETSAHAVAALDAQQRRGLRLRHIESLRWASENRPEWTKASRDELLAELYSRLASREHRRRGVDVIRFRSEELKNHRDAMAWPDVLTAIVIDEAVRTERVRAALFTQAETDRADTSTEYGGIVRISIRPGEGSVFVPALYIPRPVLRENDNSFVANPEMIIESSTALAHYHFHVQNVNNARFAGPSDGDMAYAARYGRACLVFTAIDENTLGVDLYQPDGVVLDLGDFTRPEGSS